MKRLQRIHVSYVYQVSKPLTEKERDSLIFKAAIEVGCPPAFISTRLLSKEDKLDMLNGDIPWEALLLHVQLWFKAGMPDYAHGKTEPYKKTTQDA